MGFSHHSACPPLQELCRLVCTPWRDDPAKRTKGPHQPRDLIAAYRRNLTDSNSQSHSLEAEGLCLCLLSLDIGHWTLDIGHWTLAIVSSATMPHQVLVGNSCYTSSEAQKLLDRINKQSTARVQSLRGNWLYYVDLKNGQAGLDKVQQLLQISESSNAASAPAAASENTLTFYVSPRNISPWSSKATSIAHVCGLKEQVHRVERGRVITIEFQDSYDGETASLPFRDVIHDRMTEILATEQPSLDVMFAEDERAPLVVVDIFSEGREPLEVLGDYNNKMGLALSPEEMQYLVEAYTRLGRPPHDVELFMFAQVNSEYVLQDSHVLTALL